MDGGSTDETLDVLREWEGRLAGWDSAPDGGQSAAINAGIARGTAPYVCWLNSDDILLDGSLARLLAFLAQHEDTPACYGLTYDLRQRDGTLRPAWVEPFSEKRLATRCIISQPGTLIRRNVWEDLGGLDPHLHMAMDYDLWWRIYRRFGPLKLLEEFVAVNRVHPLTKTSSRRRAHYREAINVVKRHYNRVPLKWLIAQPYKIWWKSNFREL